MKLKRFNESIEYSDEKKELIDRFGWNKEKIRYHIASPKDRNPFDLNSYQDFELAIEQYKAHDERYPLNTFCVFESRIRVMTDEEINTILAAKQYNL